VARGLIRGEEPARVAGEPVATRFGMQHAAQDARRHKFCGVTRSL